MASNCKLDIWKRALKTHFLNVETQEQVDPVYSSS